MSALGQKRNQRMLLVEVCDVSIFFFMMFALAFLRDRVAVSGRLASRVTSALAGELQASRHSASAGLLAVSAAGTQTRTAANAAARHNAPVAILVVCRWPNVALQHVRTAVAWRDMR